MPDVYRRLKRAYHNAFDNSEHPFLETPARNGRSAPALGWAQ